MALSGLCQAASLVQQVARKGTVDSAPMQASIESLFGIESDSTAAVFGGWVQLKQGLLTLIRQLDRKERDLELTRYAGCLLFLERKVVRRDEMMQTIRDGIVAATSQAVATSQ